VELCTELFYAIVPTFFYVFCYPSNGLSPAKGSGGEYPHQGVQEVALTTTAGV